MITLPSDFTANLFSEASGGIGALAPFVLPLGGVMLAIFLIEWIFGLISPKKKDLVDQSEFEYRMNFERRKEEDEYRQKR